MVRKFVVMVPLEVRVYDESEFSPKMVWDDIKYGASTGVIAAGYAWDVKFERIKFRDIKRAAVNGFGCLP